MAVDPAMKEVVVEFDQDMNTGGFSWTAAGPSFPKTSGRPSWRSKRACVLPVELEPGRAYTLCINGVGARNFKNAQGEPAEIQPISFRTVGGDAGTAAAAAEQNRMATEELREAIANKYSYRDLRGIDWDKQFAIHRDAMLMALTPDAFALAAASALEPARDPHLSLVVGNVTLGTTRREVTPNLNGNLLPRVVPGFKKQSDMLVTGKFDDGIAYIMITSWQQRQPQDMAGVMAALREHENAPGIILDVRPNSGGAEPLARQVAACFIDKPAVYAKHVTRDARRESEFTETSERMIAPSRDGLKIRGRVAVLMGPINMSSCEAFLLMMKQSPNAKLIGDRSYGSSGNPQPTKLANSVIAFIPSWQAMSPDGTVLDGKGIEPDIAVKTKQTDFATADPVLDAALKWLRNENQVKGQ